MILLSGVSSSAPSSPAPRTLNATRYHLRSGAEPEWQEFAGKVPHGARLAFHFSATTNRAEATLFIRQRDVKQDWGVEINGKRIGKLFLMEVPLVSTLTIPPGTLKEGENELTISPPRENDDIIVGEFQLDARPPAQVFGASLNVEVTDADSHRALPCRITVVDEQGALAPLRAASGQSLAARPGVVYTPDGKASLTVLPGRYTLYASRGFEYSLDSRSLSAVPGRPSRVQMRIRREVPTQGLISCDTHIHSFTYAKHGDATIEERMLTIAGEGIELPVSTEHNTLIDFAEPARRLGLQNEFTPIVGCEVTTRHGHFNAFPIPPGHPAPDASIEGWPELMDSIRSNSGARIIVLNHPRDEHIKFIPFAATNFNAVTGENRRSSNFTFNALEVINSGALRSDWREVFHDWFALLNHGDRITGVAGSDSHDVSRFIVGQGRTYVVCRDQNPGAIDLNGACQSLDQGRALISLGLLAQMTVNDKFGIGDLATKLEKSILITITVLGPGWTSADRVELYANGILLRDQAIKPGRKGPEKARIKWTLPRPQHDVYLVAIASGPGVTSPHWAIPRPYQPSSPIWDSRVIGATNPIGVDGDSDGKFTSARTYAQQLIDRHGVSPDELIPALAGYDQAVASQAASLCHSAGADIRSSGFSQYLGLAPAAVQRGFAAFANTIMKAE